MSFDVPYACRYRLLAAALAVAVGMAPALAQSPVPPANTPKAPVSQPQAPAAPVASAPAAPVEDPNTIRVLLSPELETTLASQMVGRILNLQAQLGALVQKGKPVVTFDCSEAAARMNMAQAEYASSRETLNAKERLRALDAAGDVEVSLAAAADNKAKASIALARTQLAQCSVNAPFTGRIVKVHVKPHQGVNIGAPLVEMVSSGPLKIRLNVPSRWLRNLKEGTPFEVSINETGRTYQAKISAINARVDAVAQTIELEARMDNAQSDLLAGMSGVARFPVQP